MKKLAFRKPNQSAGRTPPTETAGITFDETAAEEMVINPLHGFASDPFGTPNIVRGALEEYLRKVKADARNSKAEAQPVLDVTAARQWAPPWVPLHAALMDQPALTTLPHSAMQVMLFLFAEHARNYKNHAGLKVRLSDMRKVCGWTERSEGRLRRALDTLMRRRLIRRTAERRGSSAATYAITWLERRNFKNEE